MKKKNKRREESDYFVLRYGTGIEDRERLNSEEDKSRSGARNMCFELVCVREGEREREGDLWIKVKATNKSVCR
jgi:hypothetical protein